MKITFLASFGDIKKTVEISQPAGAAGSFFISHDNMHQGQIVWTNQGWKAYVNNADISGDECTILEDMVKEAMG